MFKVKFDEYAKEHFLNTRVVLPNGYIFKYRKGETTGIHYTGENIISVKEFNEFTRRLMFNESFTYTKNLLGELEVENAKKNLQDKIEYENLPVFIREACNKKLKVEEYMMNLRNFRKESIAHKELEQCLSNGGNPRCNYFDTVKKRYVRNCMFICDYTHHVLYEHNTDKNVYNANIIRELIKELIAQ